MAYANYFPNGSGVYDGVVLNVHEGSLDLKVGAVTFREVPLVQAGSPAPLSGHYCELVADDAGEAAVEPAAEPEAKSEEVDDEQVDENA